jgi:hypothetical protein
MDGCLAQSNCEVAAARNLLDVTKWQVCLLKMLVPCVHMLADAYSHTAANRDLIDFYSFQFVRLQMLIAPNPETVFTQCS